MVKNAISFGHGINLLTLHFDLIRNNLKDCRNVPNVMYLCEEVAQYSNEHVKPNTYINNLVDEQCTVDPTDIYAPGIYDPDIDEKSQPELRLPRIHFIIGIIMCYWQVMSKSLNIPYFEKLSNIRNITHEDIKSVVNSFPSTYNLETTSSFPNHYNNQHQNTDTDQVHNFYEKYTSNFLFVLLYATLRTDQEQLLNLIFSYENFLIVDPTFPCNMKVKKIHVKCGLLFLNAKYELGRECLPPTWFPLSTMKTFLDSKIKSVGDYYIFDIRFLLPYYSYHKQIISVFNEDYDTVQFIKDYKQQLFYHPLLKLATRVKASSYNKIRVYNLMLSLTNILTNVLILGLLLNNRNQYIILFLVIRLIYCVLHELWVYQIRIFKYNYYRNLIPIVLFLFIYIFHVFHSCHILILGCIGLDMILTTKNIHIWCMSDLALYLHFSKQLRIFHACYVWGVFNKYIYLILQYILKDHITTLSYIRVNKRSGKVDIIHNCNVISKPITVSSKFLDDISYIE